MGDLSLEGASQGSAFFPHSFAGRSRGISLDHRLSANNTMPAEKKEKKSKKKEDAPAAEAAEAADAPAAAAEPKKAHVNVMALFNQNQITEFKECFKMMDQDQDGHLSHADISGVYEQLGSSVDDKVVDAMIKEATGQFNFTAFLALFGNMLHGTDSEQALKNAFLMFDPDKTGQLDEAYFKDLMINTGDQFTPDEIKRTWKEAPFSGGKLDYTKLIDIIKRGDQEG